MRISLTVFLHVLSLLSGTYFSLFISDVVISYAAAAFTTTAALNLFHLFAGKAGK